MVKERQINGDGSTRSCQTRFPEGTCNHLKTVKKDRFRDGKTMIENDVLVHFGGSSKYELPKWIFFHVKMVDNKHVLKLLTMIIRFGNKQKPSYFVLYLKKKTKPNMIEAIFNFQRGFMWNPVYCWGWLSVVICQSIMCCRL